MSSTNKLRTYKKTSERYKCVSKDNLEIAEWDKFFEIGKTYYRLDAPFGKNLALMLETEDGMPLFVDKHCFEKVEDKESSEKSKETKRTLSRAALEYNKSINIQIGKLIEQQREELLAGNYNRVAMIEEEMDYLANKRYKV